MSKHWYYLKVNQRKGPFSAEELNRLVATGVLEPSDLIWRSGAPAWVRIGWIKGLHFGTARPSDDTPDSDR